MKKFTVILVAMAVLSLNAMADTGCGWGVWFDVPKSVSNTDVDGIGLGLPLIANRSTEGLSLALIGNNVQKLEGLQFAFFGFNYAKTMEGAQVGFVNLNRGQHGDCAVQIGCFNQSGKNGVQLGFINNGKDNATFQLGFLNINKNGLLPVMIFINFGTGLFD